MKENEKYIVVTSHCTEDGQESFGDSFSLEQNVNIYLDNGWKLAGGMVYVPDGDGVGYLAQAVVGHGVDF